MELLQSQDSPSTAKQQPHEPVVFSVDVEVKHETGVDPKQLLGDIALLDNREDSHEPERNTKLMKTRDMRFTIGVEVKHETEVSSDLKQARDNSYICEGSERSLKALKTSVKTFEVNVSASSCDAEILGERLLQQIVDGCFIKLQPLRLLHCDMCRKVFQKRSQLVAHIIDNHSGDTNSTVSDEDTERNHLTEDIDSDTSDILKLYPCNICHEQFAFKNHMKIHKLKHQGKEPLVCDICGKDFPKKTHLRIHMNTHFKRQLDPIGEPIPCQICNKVFTDPSKLKNHLKHHTRLKRFKCKVCPKSFCSKANLRVHYRVHTGEKPFSCSICKKQYSQRGNLTLHYRIHADESYECGVKNLSGRDGYKKTYKKTRKLFSCDLCNRKFSKKYGLIEHVCVHITGEKPYYTCDICKEIFCGKTSLSSHKEIHKSKKPVTRPNPYQCEICEKSFRSKSYLTIHSRVHTGDRPYSCEVCNKAFISKSNLTMHQVCHKDVKPHECEYCKKRFRYKCDLNRHISLHTGEKRFKCDLCSKAYSHVSNLKSHKLKCH